MFIIKLLVNIILLAIGLFGAWKASQYVTKLLSLGTTVIGFVYIMTFVVILGLIQYFCLNVIW